MKAGDIVECVEPTSCGTLEKGKRYKIDFVSTGGGYGYFKIAGKEWINSRFKQVTPEIFKVGDRVKALMDTDHFKFGDEFIVKECSDIGTIKLKGVPIDWDNRRFTAASQAQPQAEPKPRFTVGSRVRVGNEVVDVVEGVPVPEEAVLFQTECDEAYLTEGGYAISLNRHNRAPVELSPGFNSAGDSSKGRSIGWKWQKDGSIMGMKPEWAKSLKITEVLPHFPELPSGYKWAGGFPQYQSIDIGEFYVGKDRRFYDQVFRATDGKAYGFPIERHLSGNLPPVGREDDKIDAPEYVRTYNQPPACVTAEIKISPEIAKDLVVTTMNGGTVPLVSSEAAKMPTFGTLNTPINLIGSRSGGKSVFSQPSNLVEMFDSFSIVKKEEQMTPQTAINVAKKTASVAFGVVNFLWLQPAWNMAKPLGNFARYTFCVASLAGAAYAVYDREPIVKFIGSCLPDITIEAPAILK
jgi:hypothetical protein